ncbi:DHA2 family efflux MFS transporter permease subunit [Nocardioides marmoribigeumensis]|uniref:EmrB/QacA subfamily drug resistance transporter n=1 Tax=Nocardioides marmoribigeumensis TaxID=433649 RepID=A0ABU2BV93_9ACTN|nr:DHA2 family efflux MFS transporter permease subunit [Nocardioides marmoribigeumensis]MDR7362558.1 EmrB/QacA subfamily drug resistance transporter [Nocardioides marmoribigeumensis]
MTQTQPRTSPAGPAAGYNPWAALAALCLGFFMILVDTTIVSVATPAIIEDLQAEVNSVVWVTSAYLLAYAVPLLITGRLGDRFGQKWVYLAGLAVFTLSSLWCGLTHSVETLIVARAFQGIGGALMTPQTMATITRIFPAESRGKAMAMWGATAGLAMLVGPILGGVLVDSLGWEWIFFINVPVGVVGFVLAWRLVPLLPTHPHRFDWLGVALSGVAMFLLVFGIQEGHQYDWGRITGFVSVPLLIVAGVVVLAGFVWQQRRNTEEPLLPMNLFADRNFSLANVAISCMGFAVTAFGFPLMLWAQLVRGYSPTEAALLFTPMAVTTMVLAPVVGRWTDSVHPRRLVGAGFALLALSMVVVLHQMTPGSSVWTIIAPMTVFGVGNALVWAPNSATATRNLAMHQAGAGAGVYNATRQVASVLGSAAVAVLIDSRLAAQGLVFDPATQGESPGGGLPPQVIDRFSTAMAEASWLVPAAFVVGFVAVMFFERPGHQTVAPAQARPAAQPG